ncbi:MULTISPECIES: hypothetical protein [Saliphagus]|uniref:Uncharacterized protein n=1 Tax=Saliphagus infecundisoli TaxID=1849069 RepID=A0ABD5QEV7_9EURY|nr:MULTISPECIES: hypothetical protein [Saliphagus]
MGTVDSEAGHPFENPLFRYGIGLSGAIVIIAVAILYLDGVARYVALAIAVLDGAVTPKILEYAAAQDAQT